MVVDGYPSYGAAGTSVPSGSGLRSDAMVVPTSSDPLPPPPVVPRWGLGDALWVWFAALAVAVVAGGLLVGLRGSVGPGASDIIEIGRAHV